jgi:hypothetical protein
VSSASVHDQTRTSGPGTVHGAPRLWLRLEAATLLAGALIAYSTTNQPWWLIPLTFLAPDVSAAGYLGGAGLGTRLYNIAHVTPLPAAAIALGWWQHMPLVAALGLVWLAHIGLDRSLGYGLKYSDDFGHTHLSWKTHLPRTAVATTPAATADGPRRPADSRGAAVGGSG